LLILLRRPGKAQCRRRHGRRRSDRHLMPLQRNSQSLPAVSLRGAYQKKVTVLNKQFCKIKIKKAQSLASKDWAEEIKKIMVKLEAKKIMVKLEAVSAIGIPYFRE
jgi:hypothetical protein